MQATHSQRVKTTIPHLHEKKEKNLIFKCFKPTLENLFFLKYCSDRFYTCQIQVLKSSIYILGNRDTGRHFKQLRLGNPVNV